MKTIVSEKLGSGKVVVEEGCKLQFVLVANESISKHSKLEFELKGKDSELSFIGFVIGKGDDFFEFETVSNHSEINTKANFNLGAVLFDRSKVDFKGNIVIPKQAQMTDAFLTSKMLLAGDGARAKAIPCLEIEADDVKAGHAATIGKVDSEEMFYLQSRGIDKKAAEELLVMSFFESQLALIIDLKTREHVRDIVKKSLPLT